MSTAYWHESIPCIKEKHISLLAGIGAELAGGRWNLKCVRAVYTASSRALAMAETLVQPGFEQIPGTYHIAQINVPDNLEICVVDMSDYDLKDWWMVKHSPITKTIGTTILTENKFPVIRVPSIVVKGDFNYIVNPYMNIQIESR